ncbi:hypothetical protein [Candidatus Magnetobacterium casense]|uniref:Uncharacterized protein n=1 Tax=Candidatus Magnetobacterium casense TaxID=1455061 RepID=A0ABS6RU72_9BACT|nr:hypothetical protein [Candidatus Magnetobacterium casensis]MBV6340170.1 hypothetical protein [Candidatus Magnetobacterium casensis]
MSIEITAYIEKEYFEAPGICTTDICKTEISVSTDSATKEVTVLAPIMKSGDVVNKKMVTADIIKDNQTQTSCLICRKPCVESGVKAPVAAALTQTTPITPTGSPLPLISTTLMKPDPGQPSLPATHQGSGCAAGCPKLINWKEDYDDIGYLQYNQQTGQYSPATYKRSRLTLTTEVDIPQVCGMNMLSMSFEVSPCYAYWDLTQTRSAMQQTLSTTPSWLWQQNLQGIPADNSLKWTYPAKWSNTWHFTTGDVCFYPGEAMYLYAHVKDPSGRCNQILVGYGWFETNCLTSGIIQGCGLLKKNTYKQNKEYIQNVDLNGKRISRQNISNVDVFTKYKGHYTYIKPEQPPVYAYSYSTNLFPMLGPVGGQVVTTVYHVYKNYTLDATGGSIQLPWDNCIHSSLFPVSDLYLDYTWQQWDVLAGGYLQHFNQAWIGNPDFHWLVDYKGSLSWVNTSDFTEYRNGDRVLIFKGGKGKNPLLQTNKIQIAMPYQKSTFLLGKTDIVSAKVTRTLNPATVYAIGRDYIIDSTFGTIYIQDRGAIHAVDSNGISTGGIDVEYTYHVALGKNANDYRNCRLFDSQNTPLGDDTLASSNVSYSLDTGKDIIIPTKVR